MDKFKVIFNDGQSRIFYAGNEDDCRNKAVSEYANDARTSIFNVINMTEIEKGVVK